MTSKTTKTTSGADPSQLEAFMAKNADLEAASKEGFPEKKMVKVFGKEFYKVIPIDADKTVSYAAQLNSTFGILQREILGLVNLGDGAIKFSADDVALFDVDPALESNAFQPAFEHMASRELHPIEEELKQDDRRAVDGVLFEALRLTTAEQEQVYSATFELVTNRTRKAESRKQS